MAESLDVHTAPMQAASTPTVDADAPSPVTIAIANDYELVVRGLAAVLAPYSDRIRIVELDTGVEPSAPVDVILYDTYAHAQGGSPDLTHLRDGATKLLIFSWHADGTVEPDVDPAAAGYIAKTAGPEELVEAIEAVYRGEATTRPTGSAEDLGRWPGDEVGLSNRESEVLALITQGLSNEEIREITHVSKNTLKTYIRNLYRKIDVTRRSQAVIWGVDHDYEPDRYQRSQLN